MTKFIKVNRARAGSIYEIGNLTLRGNTKIFIGIDSLIFIRYVDIDILYYELLAGDSSNIFPPLHTRPHFITSSSFYLKEIDQQELPLYIHLSLKTKLFDNLLRGDNPKDKIMKSCSTLIRTLRASLMNPEVGQLVMSSSVSKNFPDMNLDNCFSIPLKKKNNVYMTRLL